MFKESNVFFCQILRGKRSTPKSNFSAIKNITRNNITMQNFQIKIKQEIFDNKSGSMQEVSLLIVKIYSINLISFKYYLITVKHKEMHTVASQV